LILGHVLTLTLSATSLGPQSVKEKADARPASFEDALGGQLKVTLTREVTGRRVPVPKCSIRAEETHGKTMNTFDAMSIFRGSSVFEGDGSFERLAHAPRRGAPMNELCEDLVDGFASHRQTLFFSPCQVVAQSHIRDSGVFPS
jgi:hypothetical protein